MRNTIITLVTLGVQGVLFSVDTLSCSLAIPLDEYIAISLEKSRWYWLVSAFVGVLVSGIHFSRTRRILVPSIVVALVVFHPAWTANPMPASDCVSMSERMSQVVMVIFVVLLVIEFLKITLNRKVNAQNYDST